MRHVIFENDVIQILQKQEVEPAYFELFRLKLSTALNQKWKLREFIVLKLIIS